MENLKSKRIEIGFLFIQETAKNFAFVVEIKRDQAEEYKFFIRSGFLVAKSDLQDMRTFCKKHNEELINKKYKLN